MSVHCSMEQMSVTPDEAVKLFINYSEQVDSPTTGGLNETLIIIEGNLVLPFEVTKLPHNLLIQGDLDASLSPVKNFNGVVTGNANFFESQIESFGPDARFDGQFDASSTSHLRTFNCEVKGDALFCESSVEFFGPRAHFGGNLNAVGARKLKTFNHPVAGTADFSYSGLDAIGPNATFGTAVVVAKETPYQRRLDDPRRWNMNAANKMDKIVKGVGAKGGLFKKKRNALSTTSPFRTKSQLLMLAKRAA